MKLALTVNEAAEALGFCRYSLYKLIQKGIVPSIKLGGRYRIPVEALNDLLHSAGKTDGGKNEK